MLIVDNNQHFSIERDLGIMISNDLKPTEQVNKAAAKGNSLLGLFKNVFVTRDQSTWTRIYKLEFAIAAWSPYRQKHIVLKKYSTGQPKWFQASKDSGMKRGVNDWVLLRYWLEEQEAIWYKSSSYTKILKRLTGIINLLIQHRVVGKGRKWEERS